MFKLTQLVSHIDTQEIITINIIMDYYGVKLKPLDTFGKQFVQRPTLRVSQLIYKITNL